MLSNAVGDLPKQIVPYIAYLHIIAEAANSNLRLSEPDDLYQDKKPKHDKITSLSRERSAIMGVRARLHLVRRTVSLHAPICSTRNAVVPVLSVACGSTKKAGARSTMPKNTSLTLSLDQQEFLLLAAQTLGSHDAPDPQRRVDGLVPR